MPEEESLENIPEKKMSEEKMLKMGGGGEDNHSAVGKRQLVSLK